MEQTLNITHSQSVGYHIPLRVPAYLQLVFILLTGFAVANVGVRTLALTAQGPPNPFTAYDDIFPGQPATTIQSRASSCIFDHDEYNVPTGLFCVFAPTEGVFSTVSVIISGGIIRNISFIMCKNTLTVGDLQIFLGVPFIHKYPRTAYFALPRRSVIAKTIVYAGQFSLFLPVRSITFTKRG